MSKSWWHYHASATQSVRSLYEIQPREDAPEEKGTVVWGQNSVVFEGEGEVVQDIVKVNSRLPLPAPWSGQIGVMGN